jgi:hypothetical protein
MQHQTAELFNVFRPNLVDIGGITECEVMILYAGYLNNWRTV